jgi:methyl-accepting chemotaxis protein
MAQPSTTKMDARTPQQSLDQVAESLDEINSTLERIARAVEATSAAG